MQQRIGVIGLGLLGSAIAERLLEHGYHVIVHNRTKEKAKPLIDQGAIWSDNPFAETDRLVISLYSSDVVQEVINQLIDAVRPGTIVIDTTTCTPSASVGMAELLASRQAAYLDAPVSGSSEQARRGEVTTMVGGDDAAVDKCRDLLDCLSKQVYHLGPVGSGSRIKLISNLVLGLNRAALAEGLGLARASGLDLETSLDVLRNSAAYSMAMDVKGLKMVRGDFSPQARLSQHLKDVRLILQMGQDYAARLPFSRLHREILQELEDLGFGSLDNSAIMKAFEEGNDLSET
jgi:2-hydroxy-3-oxopropionate reductase